MSTHRTASPTRISPAVSSARGRAADSAGRRVPALLALALLLPLGSCGEKAPTTPPPQPDRTLTVEVAGHGNGTVTSQPAGIDCSASGGTCSLTAPHGTRVTLTGTPDARSDFGGWSQACSGSGACAVTLNADAKVGAAFGNPRLAAAEIGPAGGTLVSKDGLLTLTVPVGALSAATTLTVEAIEASELGPEFADLMVDRAYDLGPDGQTFTSPVEITVRSDREARLVGDTLVWDAEFLFTSHNGAVQPLGELVTRVAADGTLTLSGQTTHFSPVTKWVADGRIELEAHVPRRMAVGVPRNVHLGIRLNLDLVPQEGWFRDGSPLPVVMADPREKVKLENFAVQEPAFRLRKDLPYLCNAVGNGFWSGYLSVLLSDETTDARLKNMSIGGSLEQQVSCEQPVRLTVNVIEPRSGTVSFTDAFGKEVTCDDSCVEWYAPGDWRVLRARPQGNFVSWSGTCVHGFSSPTSPDFTATVDEDITCNAHFEGRVGFQLVPGANLGLGDRAKGAAVPRSTQQGAANQLVAFTENGRRFDFAVPLVGGFARRTGSTLAAASGLAGPGLEVVQTIEDYCRGATEVFFHRSPTSAVAAMFVALQPDTVRGCRGVLGTTQKSTVGFASYVPNGVQVGSSHIVYSDFLRGVAHVRYIFEDPSGRHDVVLAPGKRSCPWGSDSRSNVALIVAREGAVGTSNEECNETRGLYKLEVQGFASTALTGSLLIGTMPREVVISPDGSTAYLADYAEKRIHVIDVASMTATGTIPAPGGPTSLALTNDGALLLAAYWDTNEVAAIDPASGEELAREASGGEQPVKVRLSSDEQIVWVLNYGKEGVANAVVKVFRLVRP